MDLCQSSPGSFVLPAPASPGVCGEFSGVQRREIPLFIPVQDGISPVSERGFEDDELKESEALTRQH